MTILYGDGVSDYNGLLGDNNTTNKSSPVQVGNDSDWAEFATGEGFGAAVKENGTLWIWGNNYDGVFGNDSVNGTRSSPEQLASDTNWKSISCGEFTIAAIKKDGSLYAWGNNNHGQLGDNTTTYKSSPVQIGSGNDWKQVEVCTESNIGYMLALKNDGSIWSWGSNAFGQIGERHTK
jgi:alpha-tubulin suppressor-like RCC1 family protein